MLEKSYQSHTVEARISQLWEDAGAFRCGRPERAEAEPYTIVIPPPNVTGSLHMGHALNNTLQDVLCRFERMRGRDVLWQPGTDHAGIATQMVVERQMAERQEPDRRQIGRDAFIEKVWRWKEESGGTILNQLKRLGASCDWSRERFTMDEGLSRAVLKQFVELYRTGLIYKDKRLVNWDPAFETAISDLEVENSEVDGHMWHFKYPLAGGESYEYVEKDEDGNVTLREMRDYISIATTRPETMLGDGAVAVHPSDERYAPIIGKLCQIPVGPKEHRRLIPIITDEYPDPDFGSGAVKITGAHDFNDYAVARRNDIPMYRLMDNVAAMRSDGVPYAEAAIAAMEIVKQGGTPDAVEVDTINLVPDQYRGLDRFEARARVIADIDAEGLMIEVEDKRIMQPFGDRSGVVIEPMLTDQWYVDAETMAQPALKAVRDGRTRFVPDKYAADYFRWLENIQPWCISRQLWWGHQIPAWYGPDKEIFVALDVNDAQALADAHYGKPVELTRDDDVLDTWFSSALWPFSTLGWPDETPEVVRYYPTNTLVTGFDIIFFWVARMMMAGINVMDEVPFSDVYIHALVRDEKGQKMSKSKGNVIDPLDLIDQYGADALRFTLTAMAAQGRDIKLSTQRVEGYRNFATKIWNAARFAEMNEAMLQPNFDPGRVEQTINRWIASEVQRASSEITTHIEAYKFNEAAGVAYEFVWGVFCDWYLELIKPVLNGDDPAAISETRAMIAWTFDETLKMLHPFMPFITEELWARMAENGYQRDGVLALAEWPTHTELEDAAATDEISWTIKLVSEVRSVRSEMNVPAGAKIPLEIVSPSPLERERLERHEGTISRLARLSRLTFVEEAEKGAAAIVFDETTAALPLKGVIDLDAEAKRLAKEIDKAKSEIAKIDGKLANPKFVERAPEAVVEENRERREDFEGQVSRFEAALKRLEAAA